MLIPAIASRRSVRAYRTDPVPDEAITEIVKAAQFAPTAKNNRAVVCIVVRDSGMRKALLDAQGQRTNCYEAPVIIVPVISVAASVAPLQDLAVASENIFLQAAALGLGSVWKNVPDPTVAAEICKILGVPSGHLLINIIPMGFPADPPPPHGNHDFRPQDLRWERW